jgi:predicted phosphodiesterase
VSYRVTARTIEFKNAYNIVQGKPETSATKTFRTLDPAAREAKFIVWNDTHENLETIRALHEQTHEFGPDFLLWNGDQTNDVYDQAKMTNQYLAPAGLELAGKWPLAYARGNHDVRGPAARHLPEFTGTPDDRFYYGFRSGPLAALVMDTGEDKPDDHPVFAGLAGFAAMRERQTKWLAATIREPWFREAPFRVLFCHIPLWWTDEKSNPGYFLFAKPCREAWLPLLIEGKVQLVVSGHTHRASWLPSTADQPIPQLIGGGPRPAGATIMHGTANAQELKLHMRSLTGETLQEVTIAAS